MALAVLVMVGLLFTQLFVTSPGRTTDVEWHIMLLAAVPSMTTVLTAFWVGDGRPPIDRR